MAPRRHRLQHALRQVRRQRLPLLTAAVVVVVIALVTVTISPQRSFHPGGEPKTVVRAIPSSTNLSTPPKPGQPAPVKANKYTCPGFSGVETPNPLSTLYQDKFKWGIYPAYQVGNGKGDINWRSNPYNQPSWYMWLHSLRWLGQGIQAAGKGDKAAMARVTTIIHDWVNDNPYDWKVDVGAHEATMHRTNVLICTRQAILSGLKVKTLPASYAWLDKALLDHARFMEINFGGPGNHGTDESIAMFGIGCTLDREPLKELAQRRLARAITEAIDEQGSTNEQSTGYAQFNYSLWGRAAKALKECGADPGSNINTRRAALAKWLVMATDSLGKLHQLGDSEVIEALPGHHPAERVGIFDAGYIFGHTGWGEKRPLALESTYSIRFGPAPTLHGHDDHMSITYTSHGRQILIDGGHSGYQKDKWRDWVHSQAAHNVMTSPEMEGHRVETKLLRSEIKSTSEFYELADEPAPGMTRNRSVLVLKDPDLIVALDRATAENDQPFETLWHLAEGQQVTVSSPTQAVAQKPGDKVKTVLLQIPYSVDLPGDAITVEQGKDDPVQGWHFPKATQKVSAPTVGFHRNGKSATILSLIVPAASKAAVSYTTRTTGSTYLIDLTVGTLHTTIAVQPDGTLSRLK
ncbi:heparinase II/III-family protein [Kribbella sp. NBC_00382]|uniref:heparinase II/III domain-containing protein n=1 Tax=Kribbella sp. NBC_00382 TaxID=2975967 RepID=UPI002E24F136